MSLVNVPLSVEAPHAAAAGSTAWAMQVGQHVSAVLLTTIGVVRALDDATSPVAVVAAGAVLLAWHTAGTLVAARPGARRRVTWWLIGLAGVWLVAVTISAEFVWVAFPLWLLAGHLLPLRWGLVFSAGVLAAAIAAPLLHHGSTTYADVLGPLIGGIFAFGISRGYLQLLHDAQVRERLVVSLTRAQEEMTELHDELLLAQRQSGAVAERTRISRDIHDTIAQSLTSIRLLARAQTASADSSSAAATLAQVAALAEDSLADVRRIVAALVPAELEDDALAAALQRMLDRTQAEAGLAVELHVDDTLPLLPTEVEVALLRTAQSALANVRLHAHASRVVVSLVDAGDTVRLDLIDDGVGFDAAAWERASDPTSSSFGLRFMRTRLRELGGGLELDSSPGEGTSVSAHLPLYATSEEKP